MACCIPIRIINNKYKKLARELSDDPDSYVYQYEDREDFFIDVPCGVCINCIRSKATMWNTRLQNEWKYLPIEDKKNSYFITLTISDKYIDTPPSILVRRFLERVRRKYKRSPRHWFITEYGDETKRLHLHGVFFNPPFHRFELSKLWFYGYVSIAPLTARRITYVTTYITKMLKIDSVEDPRYHQQIFTSPGLGKKYCSDPGVIAHCRVDGVPSPFGFNPSNKVIALPRYYRGKLFSDDELEDLKNRYYANLSDDVVPPPPYFIGKHKYTDYTLYRGACELIRKKKYQLYKSKKNEFRPPQPPIETIGY